MYLIQHCSGKEMMPPSRWVSNIVAKPYQLYFLWRLSSDVSFNSKLNAELKLSALSLPFFLWDAVKYYSLVSVYLNLLTN
jgi:hypothetical protein